MNVSHKASLVAPLLFAAVAALAASGTGPALADDLTNVTGAAHDGGTAVPLRTKDVRLSTTAVCAIAWKASIPHGTAQLWYSSGWPHGYVFDWSVMADTVSPGPSVSLSTVATQLVDSTHVTYWLKVANYSSAAQTFEARVCLI